MEIKVTIYYNVEKDDLYAVFMDTGITPTNYGCKVCYRTVEQHSEVSKAYIRESNPLDHRIISLYLDDPKHSRVMKLLKDLANRYDLDSEPTPLHINDYQHLYESVVNRLRKGLPVDTGISP